MSSRNDLQSGDTVVISDSRNGPECYKGEYTEGIVYGFLPGENKWQVKITKKVGQAGNRIGSYLRFTPSKLKKKFSYFKEVDHHYL